MDRYLLTAAYRNRDPENGETRALDTANMLATLPALLADEAPALAALLARHVTALAPYSYDPDRLAASLAAGILRDLADTAETHELGTVAARLMDRARYYAEPNRITGTFPAAFVRVSVGTDPEYGIPSAVSVPAALMIDGTALAVHVLDTLADRCLTTLADAFTADVCLCGAPTVAALPYCGACPASPPADTRPETRLTTR